MRRAEIRATFWGGAPDGPESIDDGLLGLSDSGVVDYDWYDSTGAVATRRTAVMLLPDELRAMSTNSANAGSGAKPQLADLKVLCERDGDPFIAIFAGTPADVRSFMGAVQRQRASVGEDPLPTIEALLAR